MLSVPGDNFLTCNMTCFPESSLDRDITESSVKQKQVRERPKLQGTSPRQIRELSAVRYKAMPVPVRDMQE
jgi:hypothetical protein